MSTITINHVKLEPILMQCLQKNVSIHMNNKVLKKGRLLLYRKTHYFIQLALLSDKQTKENFDIPIPFNVENYIDEGILYFDYRINSLHAQELPKIPEKGTSVYLNKILEIHIS